MFFALDRICLFGCLLGSRLRGNGTEAAEVVINTTSFHNYLEIIQCSTNTLRSQILSVTAFLLEIVQSC